MKYIIFDNIFPVIFNEAIGHNDIKVSGMKPTSAGFVEIFDDHFSIGTEVSGKSVSLNLPSKKEDSKIITKTLSMY
jgi:hypothetical protein